MELGNQEDREDEQFTGIAYWAKKVTTINIELTRHLQTIPRQYLHAEIGDRGTEANSNSKLPTPSKKTQFGSHISPNRAVLRSSKCHRL